MHSPLSRRAWFGVAGTTAVGVLAACGPSKNAATTSTVTVPEGPHFATETPRPDIMIADTALTELKQGNQRFVTAAMTHPDQSPQTRLSISQAQKPFAIVLSCSDSRLPPEVIFDQGLGDLFTVRVAGNIVDPAGLGSIEYAVGHLGTPLIVVLGHQNCGAVSATLDSLQHHSEPHGDVAALITAITPAVAVAQQRPGDLLVNTINANIEQSRDLITRSSQLQGPLDSGALKIVTGYYSLDDGAVTFG